MTDRPDENDAWAADWIASVTEASMTQRKLTTVERHGGLATVKRAAEAAGIHLVVLTDDKGEQLVAASRHPFTVIC